MGKGASMDHISLRFAGMNVGLDQSSCTGNASGMEARSIASDFFEFDFVEEFEPFGAGPLPPTVGRRLPGSRSTFTPQPRKQGNQLGMQHGGNVASSFGVESDNAIREVHGGLRVQAGLAYAAALVASDGKAVSVEFAQGEIFNLSDARLNHGVMFVGERRFQFARSLFQAELDTGIADGKIANQGFAHNNAQNFQLEQSRIASGAVTASCVGPGLQAPGEIVEAVLAAEQSGSVNCFFTQENLESVPAAEVSFQGAPGITGEKEIGDPGPTRRFGWRGALEFELQFEHGLFGLNPARGADLARNIPPAMRGALLHAGRGAELHPIDIAPEIKAGHDCTLAYPAAWGQPKISGFLWGFVGIGERKTVSGVRIPLSPPLVFLGNLQNCNLLYLAKRLIGWLGRWLRVAQGATDACNGGVAW